MNNSVIRILVVAVAFIICMPGMAFSVSSLSCSSTNPMNLCHANHRDKGKLGFNNICLYCHRPGRSDHDFGQLKQFIYSDQSNIDGPSRGTLEPNKQKSSHNWELSDENAGAGAQRSSNPVFAKRRPASNLGVQNEMIGYLYCSKCHVFHPENNNIFMPNFTRLDMTDTPDKMCLDCHKPRNSSTHISGTHPINVTYASVAAQKRFEYYTTPKNANPQNPTSDLNGKLKSGKVLCMTCHGIHYTDSNSRTLDNYSSAIFGGLSSSKGYLLRTDLYGRTASDVNICTNCHKTTDSNPNAKVKNHNGKGQNIQCADCHGGHVDEADASIPNVFLIKRYMNVSSATGKFATIRNQKAMYIYTSSIRKNYYADQFGVCAACHKSLPLDKAPQHDGYTSDARECNSCHIHKEGFTPNCNTCHGFPPQASGPGGPNGYAEGYQNVPGYLNESLSPHKKHAAGGTNYRINCAACHNGATHNMNATYQDVFIEPPPGLPGGPPAYSITTRVCSNVYCHSNGAPRELPMVYKPITWEPGVQTTCNSCHDAAPSTNAHGKHLTQTQPVIGCVKCHSRTVSDNTTILPSARAKNGAHVNGSKEVAFTILGSYSSSSAKCLNIYCHSNGKGVYSQPIWTNPASGACGTCHLTTNLDSGAHTAHLSAVYGPILNADAPPISCNYCHSYPDFHINESVQTPPNSTCTAACHQTPPPPWVAGRISCEVCHTAPVSVIYTRSAPDKTLAATVGHNNKFRNLTSSAKMTCIECHNNNAAHIYKDNTYNARLQDKLTGPLNQDCNYCHRDPAKVSSRFLNMSTHFTNYPNPPGVQSMQCMSCHDLHGTTNNSMVRTKIVYGSLSANINFTNRTVSMIDMVTNKGLCQVCHTRTNHYKNGITDNTHPTDNCFSCHPHNAPGGAFKPAGRCDACHGYPPVPKSFIKGYENEGPYKQTFGRQNNYTSARFEDYSGGGGAHLNHVSQFARASEGWTHCTVCHNGGSNSTTPNHKMAMPWKNYNSQNATLDFDPRFRFNQNLQIIYSGAKLVAPPEVNKTGKCYNVMCHFQPTPRWSVDR